MKILYELSVWEDVRVSDGLSDYFDEVKIAVIDSDSMDSPCKATNIILKETISGELTLSFNIPYKIFDSESGSLIDNPFFPLLINERKIKLRQGPAYIFDDINGDVDLSLLETEDEENRWKDFIIKTIEKNSTTYSAEITAKESSVSELCKNGWEVVLNTELENNFGSVNELATSALKNSGWVVGENSYSPTETTTTPLFFATVKTNGTINKILGGAAQSISAGDHIYPFYGSATLDENDNWQFNTGLIQVAYLSGREITSSDLDDSGLLIDADLNYNFEVDSSLLNLPQIAMAGSPIIFGEKIEKKPVSVLEKTLNQFVTQYTSLDALSGQAPGQPVFGYEKTEYLNSKLVQNLITNSTNFVSNSGWSTAAKIRIFPDMETTSNDWYLTGDYFSSLSLDFSGGTSFENANKYINKGPHNSKMELVKDKIYVVRVKARWIMKNDNTGIDAIGISQFSNSDIGLAVVLEDNYGNQYTTSNTILSDLIDVSTDINQRGYGISLTNISERIPFNGTNLIEQSYHDIDGYTYCYIKANQSTKHYNTALNFAIYGFTNDPAWGETFDYCIDDIQLFEYQEDTDNIPFFYGDAPSTKIKTTSVFYRIEQGEVQYLSENRDYYAPVYSTNFESIRSIDIKESNYFNIIQSLAELFEVWVRFQISHRKNGKILLVNKNPVKKVIFSKYASINTENSLGFKYGINLKSIKRSVDSESIATKIIVKNNNQEFAKDGMCSISRAVSNPSGEIEIYNFDYFIKQGFLSFSDIFNDLYGTSSSDFAYYTKMKALNNTYDSLSTLVAGLLTEKLILESQAIFYSETLAAINQKLFTLNEKYNTLPSTDGSIPSLLTTISQLRVQSKNYERLSLRNTASLTNIETLILQHETELTDIREQKISLKEQFHIKYSRFTQEGIWIDESYIDDEFYYLDAKKLSNISAFPKISYNIETMDLQGSRDLSNYTFKVGEKTFIEDVQFFGYVVKNIDAEGGAISVTSPYKMEVIISETIKNFDEPDKSSIVIKNYKNQYEELFSKIQASSQGLQFSSGAINRAVNITNSIVNGTNTPSAILQDGSFVAGSGSEITDPNNNNNRIRISGQGIYITNDGGISWTLGLSGEGLNTNCLSEGQINVTEINLVQGRIPYFRWDRFGLTAYKMNDTSGITQYDPSNYVRFNQFGLYGYVGGLTTENIAFGTSYNVNMILTKYNISLLDFNTINETAYDDITKYDLFLTEMTFKIPYFSIDTYIARTDISINDKIKYIQEHTNFFLSHNGLSLIEQNGNVVLTPESGLQIFGNSYFDNDIFDYSNEWYEDNLSEDSNFSKYIYRIQKNMTENYVPGDKIPLLTLGQFYDIDSLTGNIVSCYGIRLRNHYGRDILTTDYKGRLMIRDVVYLTADISASNDQNNYNEESELKYIRLDGYRGEISAGNDLQWESSWTLDRFGRSFFTYMSMRGIINSAIFKKEISSTIGGTMYVAPTTMLTSDIYSRSLPERGGEDFIPIGMSWGDYWSGDDYGFASEVWGKSDRALLNIGYSGQDREGIVDIFTEGTTKYLNFHGLFFGWEGKLKRGAIVTDLNTTIHTLKIVAEEAGVEYKGPYIQMKPPESVIDGIGSVFFGPLERGLVGSRFSDVVDPGCGFFSDNIYLDNVNAKKIEITSNITFDGGIPYRVRNFKSATETYQMGDKIPLVTIGRFYDSDYLDTINPTIPEQTTAQERYGICLRASDGGVILSTDVDGKLWIRNKVFLGLEYPYRAYPNEHFKNRSIIFNGESGYIGTEIVGGSGFVWKLDLVNGAAFNYANLRGEFQKSVFSFNSESYISGSLSVAPTYIFPYAQSLGYVDSENPLLYYLGYFENDDWGAYELGFQDLSWGNADLVTVEIANTDFSITKSSLVLPIITTEVYDEIYRDKYIDFTNYKDYLTTELCWEDNINQQYMLPIGTTITNISDSINKIKIECQNNGVLHDARITMESPDGNSFYIGKLDSILTDSSFSSIVDPGYGLYCNNVYLEGKIYATNSGITNEGLVTGELHNPDVTSPVRIWAGADSSNREFAPFRVLEDGSFYNSGEKNVYIQDTIPVVTQPSLWVETANGAVVGFWLVTED